MAELKLERLLTARELGELLGFQAGTIVDWAERGEVPSFKLGGRLRFRECEVAEWLEMQRKGPGAGGEVSPTPTAVPARGVLYEASPTPLERGGTDA
jgi:excisionase family DNA binding protein